MNVDIFEKDFLQYLKEKELIKGGEKIIVGLSGGADSVALLALLANVREILDTTLVAVHIHHGIRGQEADRDARFSEEFAKKINVSFICKMVDAPGYAKNEGLTLEEAARILRYRALEEVCESEDADLIDEIRERIEKLEQKGIESYVIEKIFHHHPRKLSRMHITKDYRIFLGDYMGMEITMTPLPKAVFLLFLKHPEGIMFSYLPDYRDELMDIYSKVKGPFFNVMTAKKSIEDVTNPIGNSINEKCSRIREAFVSKFDDHLARNYYITGVRGEAKRITLPRELVKWDE